MALKFVDKEMQEDYDRMIEERKRLDEYTPNEIKWLEFVVDIMENHGRGGVLRLLRILDLMGEIEKEINHGLEKDRKRSIRK